MRKLSFYFLFLISLYKLESKNYTKLTCSENPSTTAHRVDLSEV